MTVSRRMFSAYSVQALASGGVVFLAGFGVLNLLWLRGNWPEDIPGLWQYRAATFGDGLLLPVVAGGIVYLNSMAGRTRDETRGAIAGAIAGALLALFVVASWILDPNAQRNWTLQKAHTLNFAGKYHAVFLVVCSFLFAYGGTRLALRLRHLSNTKPEQATSIIGSASFILACACAMAFVGTLILDGLLVEPNASLHNKSVAISTLAGILAIGVMIGAFLRATRRSDRTQIHSSLAWSCAIAIAFLVITVQPKKLLDFDASTVLVLVVISAALAIQYWAASKISFAPILRIKFLLCIILIIDAVTLYRSLLAYNVQGLILGSVIVWLFLLVVLYISQHGHLSSAFYDCWWRALSGPLIFTAATQISMLLLADWLDGGGRQYSDANIVTALILLSVAFVVSLARSSFQIIPNTEKVIGASGPEVEVTMIAMWAMALCAFYGTGIASISVVRASGELLSIEPRGFTAGWALRDFIAIFLTAAILAIIAFLRSQPANQQIPIYPERCSVDISKGVFELAGSAALLIAFAPWWSSFAGDHHIDNPINTLHRLHWGVIPLAISVALTMYVFRAAKESINSNIATIEFTELGDRSRRLVVLIALAVASNVGWLFGSGIWGADGVGPVSLVARSTGMVGIVLVVAVPLLVWSIVRTYPILHSQPFYLSLHHPVTNVFHDQANQLLLLSCAILYIFILGNSEADTFALKALLATILTISSLVILAPTLVGIFENQMRDHVSRERQRISPSMFERCGGDLDRAYDLNRVRVNIIEARFDALLNILRILTLRFIFERIVVAFHHRIGDC